MLNSDTHRSPRRLYLITNDKDCPNQGALLHAVEQSLAGGVSWVQFRTKPGLNTPYPNAKSRLSVCEALKKICDAADAHLFINDDLELALACGANLHIGQHDTPLHQARTQLAADRLIGVTCHDQLDLAKAAIDGGASYVSFGACFPSTTKPQASQTALSIFQAAKMLPVPTVAIGGITAENAALVWQAGADILAVSHAILSAKNIKEACQRILAAHENTSLSGQ